MTMLGALPTLVEALHVMGTLVGGGLTARAAFELIGLPAGHVPGGDGRRRPRSGPG